ncbi:DNA polymerase I [Austwickia sp. TVS 96-490-7B]|nr:DNA polymerase I [Austwickia sp. TVS 96-490-7B]
MAYRAFYALPAANFSTTTGQHTNAVYGFTSMLINLLRAEEPTHLAVAFDLSRQTFRLEEYPEYKAGRSATPTEFAGQVPLIREVLDALNIPHLDVAGFEADDIIATLATRGAAADMQTLIVSGDRDALQLVDERTTVLYPVKGVSELLRMTPDLVLERYGVTPQHYRDLAALVGESADNLPGVPGVGPKTAAKWIAQYGGVEDILTHADTIKGKAGQSLRERADDVRRNHRLNQLVRDVELPVDLDALLRRDGDRDKVHQLFDSLEFAALRDRLDSILGSHDTPPDDEVNIDGTVLTSGQLTDWLSRHVTADTRIGLDVTGQWSRGTGDAQSLAIATAQDAAWIDLTALTESDDAALAALLADPRRLKTLHDAKGPVHALAARGYALTGIDCDTALAAYLVRPDQRSYDLADLALRHLGRDITGDPAGEATGQGMLDLDVDGDAGAHASMARARAVLDVAAVLEEELTRIGGRSLLTDVELPVQALLARMERTGIAADRAALQEWEAHFAEKVAQAQSDAYAANDGEKVNLGSPKQLQVVLFEKFKMPTTKKTKTGYTTDAEALADLYAKTSHPFLEALLRHRDAAKLRVTVEGLLKSVADDGRIHTTYMQTIAATGRLSSTDPNLQNIPIRTEEGRRIRSAFVAGSGDGTTYESLMSADYSQIEMRIMAHLSQDAGLIEAYRAGEDLHRYVGARVFGVDPRDVTSAMRAKVKAMSYGLAYGLSAFGLSRQLSISTAEAEGLRSAYFDRFGGVRDYLQSVVEVARKQGYTETMLGRRRYLPDLTSSNRQRREMAERMALNAPIQGSAADVMKVAMLAVDRGLQEAGVASRILLQVHDELVVEIAPGERDLVESVVRDRMGSAVPLDVPLEVSVGVGRSWYDAEH